MCIQLILSYDYFLSLNIYLVAITWNHLNYVASYQGSALGTYRSQTLDDCKNLCNQNTDCNSFAFATSNGDCLLKDRCVTASTQTSWNQYYKTYYKDCNGNIINVVL